MKTVKIVSISCLALLPLSLFGGFGLPKIPGVGKQEAAAAANIDTSALQGDLIVKFLAAQKEISTAQEYVGKALGLKKAVADLEAQKAVYEKGSSVSKDELEKVKATSDAVSEEIRKKIKEGATLSEESKKELIQAAPHMALGSFLTKELVPAAKDFVQHSGDEIKAAGLTGALNVKKKLEQGLYVAPKVPGHLKDVLMTTKDLFAFMKANKIEVPKEATSQLPDDI